MKRLRRGLRSTSTTTGGSVTSNSLSTNNYRECEGVEFKVGSVPHPMEDRLKPGDKPEAEFEVKGKVVARAYCNVHGLWIEE